MDIELTLNELTLEEKIQLMEGKDNWHTNGIERLGIPSISMSDGPSGVRVMDQDGNLCPATAIPTESALSASWNVELEEKIGRIVGEECKYYKIGMILAPGVNGKRSPLGGRNFEYFSEAPLLAGKFAAAYVRGVQSNGVSACIKHYVVNEQETKRTTIDIEADERCFRELYLKPFEIAIKEGNPWAVMGAYSKFRGTYLCENRYALQEILRDEYHYDGVIISDWSATVHKVESHRNGLDIETGSNGRSQEIMDAVRNGSYTEEELDQHIRHILQWIERLDGRESVTAIDWEKHHQLAREAAAESIVLLKNKGGILPLKKQSRIAVLGKFAAEPRYKGAGSSFMNPWKIDIPLECLKEYFDVSYAPGYQGDEEDQKMLSQARETAQGKDAVLIFVGTSELIECEGSDRKDIRLPASHLALIKQAAQVNSNIVVVNASGSAVELTEVEKYAKAILHTGLCGEGCGRAVADIISGAVNPSGKLSETYPCCIENTPAYPFFPAKDRMASYSESIFSGYRYYDSKKIPVQYPFGYGLSYTDFEYGNMRLSADRLRDGDELEVSIDITNKGTVSGKEVVQIYISKEKSCIVRAQQELKDFCKVLLEPGETKTVTFRLDDSSFHCYSEHLQSFAVENGRYHIMAAASSRDIRAESTVFFDSKDDLRPPLDDTNSLEEYLNDDRYKETTECFLELLGLSEDGEMRSIALGVSLHMLPSLLDYYQVSREVAGKFVKCIYDNDKNQMETIGICLKRNIIDLK